jgi:hypothetical protein
MTLEEKRAGNLFFIIAYYIAYGAHGARAPGDPTLNYRVAGWVTGFMIVSFALWKYSAGCKFISNIVKPKLVTQTPEWKEAEKELMIEQKQNPFRGPYADHLKKQ